MSCFISWELNNGEWIMMYILFDITLDSVFIM